MHRSEQIIKWVYSYLWLKLFMDEIINSILLKDLEIQTSQQLQLRQTSQLTFCMCFLIHF